MSEVPLYPCTLRGNAPGGRVLPDIEQWSQSSGSNVIPRRARPGLAGLRPHSAGAAPAWRSHAGELKSHYQANGSNATPMAPTCAESSEERDMGEAMPSAALPAATLFLSLARALSRARALSLSLSHTHTLSLAHTHTHHVLPGRRRVARGNPS